MASGHRDNNGWMRHAWTPPTEIRVAPNLPAKPKTATSATELRRWADRLDDQIRAIEDHGGQPQTVRALEDLRDDIERSARMG